jgi:hypothetical protein
MHFILIHVAFKVIKQTDYYAVISNSEIVELILFTFYILCILRVV